MPYNKYYKQKKQVSYDEGQTWQDVTPPEYQKGALYEEDSPDCQPIYRWVNMDISTDWVCYGTTKYYKQKKQVSNDNGQTWQDVIPYEYQSGSIYETESTDCGYVPIIYRWVNMDISTDYICDGTTKYYKQKKQISFDGGATWSDVTPAQYQRGDVYETQSTDCGYVPPTPTGTKFQATYSGGQTYEKECDGNSTLASGDTKPSTYTYSAMTSAVIGNCVTEIGDWTFESCKSLTSVTIPNSVIRIGDVAFAYCSGLTNVTIPSSVTNIGYEAFYYCKSLTSVTIPNNVTSIGWAAFSECRSLTSIDMPDSVTSIGNDVLLGCDSLTSITVDANNTVYDSRNGCNAIIETSTNELISGCKTTVIPNSVIRIGNDAFSHCRGLESITIPNSVASIGINAFTDCYSLTSIIIPNNVTSIREHTFHNCNSLTSVTIPSSVTEIERYAFYNCYNLPSITIPNGVTSIGEMAFAECEILTSITVLATTPPTLGSNVLKNTPSTMKIYVPANSVNAYKTASGWSGYASKIFPIT